MNPITDNTRIINDSGSTPRDPFREKQNGEFRNPSVSGVLQFFQYAHLPTHLQDVSRPIGELALAMADALPENPELTAGLRKLLEAKDCLVRAKLYK